MIKTRSQRQSRLQRRVFCNDIMFLIAPFLLILLLFSGRSEAFQFPSGQTNQYSLGSKLSIQSTTAGRGVVLKSNKRQPLSSLLFSSPSIEGRSESGKNSTDSTNNDGPLHANTKELETAQRLASNDDVNDNNNKDALKEATALRAMAEELRAEAKVMELELKRKATKQQQEKDKIVDEMIDTLFLPLQYQDPMIGEDEEEKKDIDAEDSSSSTPTKSVKRIPDARVVADRLRQGKFTREQVLSVVDRLFAQHHDAIHGAILLGEGAAINSTATKTKPQEPSQRGSEVNVDGRYFDYFQVFLQAASFLDLTFEDVVAKPPTTATSQESISQAAANTTSFTPPPPPSFVTSGKMSKAIQSRVGKLREMIQADVNRKIAEQSATATNTVVNVSSRMGLSHQYFIGGSKSSNTTSNPRKEYPGGTPNFIPLWIPSSYIPYIVSMNKQYQKNLKNNPQANATNAVFEIVRNSTLDSAELEILKSKVLLGSRFYMTSSEFAPGAALFRGNMRVSLGNVPKVVPSLEEGKNQTFKINNNTAMVFADIQKRLKASGLEEKVQLFVLPDPEALLRAETEQPSNRKPTSSRRPHIEASMDPEQKPVILALPKALTPDESKLEKEWIRKIGKRLSYPIAAMSTFFYSLKSFALNPHFFDALVMQRDATVLRYCIPLVIGFLSVQVIHEVAHYMVAKRKKIKIGLPVPLSTPFFSSLPFYGCITPLRSFPPNRAALVDFALSGPMASLAVSLCMVLGGVVLTSSATAGQITRFPFLSVHAMKSNFLLGSILSWLLPKTMMLPLAQPIPMHPLFVIGRFGMITSALNLLPIFRLDGGRACFAVMGQRQGAVISAFTILWIISNFFMSSSMLLIWTLLVAIFQMRVEIPCRDECTEVGGKREFLWFFSFMLSMSILAPFPHRGMH